MRREAVLDTVLAFLADRFAPGDALSAHTPLVGGLLVDSLSVVEIVTFLEETFDLSFERRDLDRFATPESLAALVVEKRLGPA